MDKEACTYRVGQKFVVYCHPFQKETTFELFSDISKAFYLVFPANLALSSMHELVRRDGIMKRGVYYPHREISTFLCRKIN